MNVNTYLFSLCVPRLATVQANWDAQREKSIATVEGSPLLGPNLDYRSHVLTTFFGPVLRAMMKQVCDQQLAACYSKLRSEALAPLLGPNLDPKTGPKQRPKRRNENVIQFWTPFWGPYLDPKMGSAIGEFRCCPQMFCKQICDPAA